MQLSLPAATFPTPAAASACGGKTPASPGDSSASPAESFDLLLKKDSPSPDDAKDDDGKTSTEAEQAAGILAAVLWTQSPTVTNAVPVLPALLTEGSTAANAAEVTGMSNGETAPGNTSGSMPFFGATNSRAFGKPQAASAQAQATSFAGVVAGQVPQTAVEGPTGIAATSTPAVVPQQKCGVKTAGPTTAPEIENSLNPSILAGQVVTATAVTKLAPNPSGKVAVKTATDGKIPSSAVAVAGDVTVPNDTAVSTVSSDQKTVSAFSETELKGAETPGAAVTADTQEKIAPLPAVLKDLEKSAAKVVEKYFLEPVQKAVTAASTSVGIAVAKVNAAMSSASPARTKSVSLVEPSAAFVFSTETAPTATLTIDAPAPVATVRETLAAVISAVDAIERRADIQQKSVDLNFHVGNEKLGLRVELKDGAVHTTFRTESSEMNSALAREWHSVVPAGLAREIHLAEPVFHTVATSGSDSSFTSLGQGAQQQQREHQKASPNFASSLRREFNDSPAQETASPVASTAANSSQLLNALA